MRMMILFMTGLCLLASCTAVCQEQNPAVENSQTENIQKQSLAESAGADKKFDLLYNAFKERYNDYIADVMKTLAFLILTIGWFVTSDKSREFFRRTIFVRISSIVALAILASIHIWYCTNAYSSSQRTMSLLGDLNYLGPEYYQGYEITSMHLATNMAQNAILFIVLILILFLMKRSPHAKT